MLPSGSRDKAKEQGGTLWWHGTRTPKAQTNAYCKKIACQLCSTFECKTPLSWQREDSHHRLMGQRSQPECVTKARRPIEKLLTTPSITAFNLFVESSTTKVYWTSCPGRDVRLCNVRHDADLRIWGQPGKQKNIPTLLGLSCQQLTSQEIWTNKVLDLQ